MFARIFWRDGDRSGAVADTVVRSKARTVVTVKGFMISSSECFAAWFCPM